MEYTIKAQWHRQDLARSDSQSATTLLLAFLFVRECKVVLLTFVERCREPSKLEVQAIDGMK